MKTTFNMKTLLTGALTISLSNLAFGAASNEPDAYRNLMVSYRKTNPSFLNTLLEEAHQLKQISFHNNTASPIELLFQENETIKRMELGAEAKNLMSSSPGTLSRLIGVQTKSMLTQTAWVPSFVSAALTSYVYSDEFKPFDLKSLFELKLPPKDAKSAVISYNRGGLSDFFLAINYNRSPEFLAQATRQFNEAPPKAIYFKNDSAYTMALKYMKSGAIEELTVLPSTRVQLIDASSPNITLRTLTRTGQESSPIGRFANLFYGRQMEPYNLVELSIKSDLTPAERPFSEAALPGNIYDIVLPEDGSDLYMTLSTE